MERSRRGRQGPARAVPAAAARCAKARRRSTGTPRDGAAAPPRETAAPRYRRRAAAQSTAGPTSGTPATTIAQARTATRLTGWRAPNSDASSGGVSSPRPLKSVVARKRVDGDERRARRAAGQRREPREELNQVELIEQVVLVPEHQLVERIAGGDGRAPARQLGGGAVGRHAGGGGQVAGADLEKRVIAQPARNGAVVQRVAQIDDRPGRPAA